MRKRIVVLLIKTKISQTGWQWPAIEVFEDQCDADDRVAALTEQNPEKFEFYMENIGFGPYGG